MEFRRLMVVDQKKGPRSAGALVLSCNATLEMSQVQRELSVAWRRVGAATMPAILRNASKR